MILYRVENSAGFGAYSIPDADFHGEATPASPMPCEDKRLDWYGEWGNHWSDALFSFESLEALRSWFKPSAIEILNFHARISVYECSVFKLGDKQACYDPEYADLLYSLPLKETYYGS